jgi:hypothetical protein
VRYRRRRRSTEGAACLGVTGKSPGRLLIAFTPAGKMQRFLETLTSGGNTRQNAELLRDHDMEFVGPPLQVWKDGVSGADGLPLCPVAP